MNIETNKNFIDQMEFFYDLPEGFIIIDDEKNVLKVNDFAKKLFGNIDNISKIEHQFTFDICILKEDDIIKYNPVSAALASSENFKAEVLYQISQEQYKKLILRSFIFEEQKIIIVTDLSDKIEFAEFKKQKIEQINKIEALEKENKEYSILKKKAESQTVRMSLINRISASIRDTLDIEEIVSTAINEISSTLGAYWGLFASFDNDIKNFTVEQFVEINANSKDDELIKKLLSDFACQMPCSNFGESKSTLAMPVIYRDEILGIMLFYRLNHRKEWHQEEISLVEGIAAQVGAAIYQASLFKELEKQKKELELTLINLKQAQTQLIQSEKMASLGQLVAGVAHEINTPLGSINSNNDVMARCIKKIKEKVEISEITSLLEIFEQVNNINKEATRRINAIVKTLRTFARLDEAEFKEIDMHEGLKSTLMLINHEIKHRIQVIEEYGSLPLIKCCPNLLNQVFMNILVNAYQSIEKNGVIKIKTCLKENNAQIIISDTGRGINEENLKKIFDPGFTTKGVGVGTGLGLSICYQIMQKHKGTIKAESQPGSGTTITIEIPLK